MPSSNRVTTAAVSDYVLLSPDGGYIVLTAAVFDALSMLLGANRKHDAGEVKVQCRNGGVAGVEIGSIKLK
jgi:hypothetical protein